MNSKEKLEGALDLLRQLNRSAGAFQTGRLDAESLSLLGLLQTEINQLKKAARGQMAKKVLKNTEKENRSRIKAAFQQELQNLGAARSMSNGSVQNEKVLWALEVLGAKSSDHEEELKALYRYLLKRTHPDLAGEQMKKSDLFLFENVTKAWEILKEFRIVK